MSDHGSKSEGDADQLFWQAWRYAADELSGAERAAFEDRLACDQGAREALAQAVEMDVAVVAVEQTRGVVALPDRSVSESASSPAARRTLAASLWMMLGAAACFAFMTWLGSGDTGRSSSDPFAAQGPEASLAAAWLDARAELAAELTTDPSSTLPALAEWAGASELEDRSEDIQSPDWMLAALLEMKTPTEESEEIVPSESPEREES